MNVASKELCEELYKLSQWDNTYWLYVEGGLVTAEEYRLDKWENGVFAYDLDYLLRKLTMYEHNRETFHLEYYWNVNRWACGYLGEDFEDAEIPEDALCKLAIELFKQGILPRPKALGESE